MRFVGITALVDAVIAIVAWAILMMRKSKMTVVSGKVKYLSLYLITTFIFLAFISFTMLQTQGQTMMVMAMISDLILWVSLIMYIKLMFADSGKKGEGMWIGIFCVFAAMRTLFQLAGIMGIDLSGLGDDIIYMLSNLDAWLMYAVWVPSAIVLIGLSLSSESSVVRSRSLMFAIGILLITFTWAFRLLGGAALNQQNGFIMLGIASAVGFMLLLSGVMYRGKESAVVGENAAPAASPQM